MLSWSFEDLAVMLAGFFAIWLMLNLWDIWGEK